MHIISAINFNTLMPRGASVIRYASMRISFLDPSTTGGGEASVLIRGTARSSSAPLLGSTDDRDDDDGGAVEELYRVQLPHNPFTGRGIIIGEGKPENQSHSMIFAFGEAVQTVDMNQDGCLAEALKTRNLLAVSVQTIVSTDTKCMPNCLYIAI